MSKKRTVELVALSIVEFVSVHFTISREIPMKLVFSLFLLFCFVNAFAATDSSDEKIIVVNAETISMWSFDHPDLYVINGALGLQLNCGYPVRSIRINQEVFPLNSLNPELDCKTAVEALYKKTPVKFYLFKENGKAVIGSIE